MGLDEFYRNWVLAAKQSCVGSPTNYYLRARAAWGAYNGGSGSICRFANPNSAWAAHDRDFKGKIDGQAWNKYVSNQNAASPLDVKCLAEGARPCALPASSRGPSSVLEEGLYAASSSKILFV